MSFNDAKMIPEIIHVMVQMILITAVRANWLMIPLGDRRRSNVASKSMPRSPRLTKLFSTVSTMFRVNLCSELTWLSLVKDWVTSPLVLGHSKLINVLHQLSSTQVSAPDSLAPAAHYHLVSRLSNISSLQVSRPIHLKTSS